MRAGSRGTGVGSGSASRSARRRALPPAAGGPLPPLPPTLPPGLGETEAAGAAAGATGGGLLEEADELREAATGTTAGAAAAPEGAASEACVPGVRVCVTPSPPPPPLIHMRGLTYKATPSHLHCDDCSAHASSRQRRAWLTRRRLLLDRRGAPRFMIPPVISTRGIPAAAAASAATRMPGMGGGVGEGSIAHAPERHLARGAVSAIVLLACRAA